MYLYELLAEDLQPVTKQIIRSVLEEEFKIIKQDHQIHTKGEDSLKFKSGNKHATITQYRKTAGKEFVIIKNKLMMKHHKLGVFIRKNCLNICKHR